MMQKRNRRIALKACVQLVLLLAFVAVASRYIYSELLRLKLTTIEAEQQEKLSTAITAFVSETGNAHTLVKLLKSSAAFQEALSANRAIAIENLQDLFVDFGESIPDISQIRWLDETGHEKVRVNVKHGVAESVQISDLQNKYMRPYFKETFRAKKNQVSSSRIDLNLEKGEIEHPFQPTIRFGIRTGVDDGLHNGVLIFNYNLRTVFSKIRQLSWDGGHIELVSADGYWLLHPDTTKEWGFVLDNAEQNLAIELTPLWKRLTQYNAETGFEYAQRIWSYSLVKLNPFYEEFESTSDPVRAVIYFVAVSESTIFPDLRQSMLLPISAASTFVISMGLVLIRRELFAQIAEHEFTYQLEKDKKALDGAYRDLKLTNLNLTLLQDELVESRKLSALGMMVAAVAHELNTPTGGALMALTSMKSDLNLLKQAVLSGLTVGQLDQFISRSANGLDLAEANLQRAANLVRSFKRLAVDRSHESIECCKLKDIVDDLLTTVKPLLKKSNIKLSVDLDPTIQIESYPGLLSQVIQNLLTNSISHGFNGGQGGEITLRAFIQEDGLISISVADNGVGVDADIASNIFDPFVTSQRGSGHIGLGLHLVHQWVTTVLGGSIKIESEYRYGTVFTVTLPVSVNDTRAGVSQC